MTRRLMAAAMMLFLAGSASGVELMKWERIPLQIPLTVGQERIVFVDKNVRVGFPPSLNNRLRIQSSGGAVYLDASDAFPVTRLELQDKENGEIILLDVSATAGKASREPVKVVYDGDVSSETTSDNQKVSSAGDSTGRKRSNGDSSASPALAHKEPPKLNAPVPVVLTRYAAQSLYGPVRTVEPVPGISPVSLKLSDRITTLYPTAPVSVAPLAAWSLQGSSVIALQVRNQSADKVVLDPRAVEGNFVTATFQHRWLGRAGSPEDTTVLYLVTQGRPEGAFIAEPALPQIGGKPSSKSTRRSRQ